MGLKRGQIWLSAVLYIMVAVIILTLVLEAGLPFLGSLREQSAFSNIRDSATLLDRQIVQIAGEGQGSQRVIPVDVSDGELSVDQGKIRWKLETESKVIEPRSRIELGNIVISSDIDVSAQEIGNSFILQNSRIRVNISKIGTPSNWTVINTSSLINSIKFLESGDETTGTFTFTVNNTASSQQGTGYTSLVDEGDGLTFGRVIAHINSTNYEYDIELTVDSKADFIRSRIKNFRRK